MLQEIEWPQSRRFKSHSEWEPSGFFSDCLCNATTFDLKLGFFSSSAINVLANGFAVFLYNGGHMRMVINDILSVEDKNAILKANSEGQVPFFDLHNISEIRKRLSERDCHFFECLSWLIRNERLEFKIVVPKASIGIAHSKCGIFGDGLNRVAFDGSCNFSGTALISNIESITAFCEWDGTNDVCRINDVAQDFEATFTEKDFSVNYINIEDVRSNLASVFGGKDVRVLLEDEARLSFSLVNGRFSETVKRILNRANLKINKIVENERANSLNHEKVEVEGPRFPYARPREYQQIAFKNWKNNRQKGLFAMATGTGKTITSLNCLLEIYNHCGYYKAIILVPTVTLVDQWEKECRKFCFTEVYKISSKNHQWKEDILRLKISERLSASGKDNSYIIISTYAALAKQAVFDSLNSFPSKQVLLIADEAHNLGAGQIKKRLSDIVYKRRIGLSATPERQYDEDGNKAINDFFGVFDGYTFTYSMEDAIKNGVLCRYYYYPHLVELVDSEMEEYIRLSEKIAQYVSANLNALKSDDAVLMRLLLNRKHIIHKAVGKKAVFQQILENTLKEKGTLKYTLIYVPEGNEPEEESDIFISQDTIGEDVFTDSLIDQYTAIVRSVDDRLIVRKFTAMSKERDKMLEDFASGEIDVLTSMKCLDEGVDVPRSEMAIFCASTGNPRQFIQRRGRILRQHPDKHIAVIHDLVVIPKIDTSATSFAMEKNLLSNELNRVKDFALLSENSIDSIRELNEIMSYYGLSMFNNNIIDVYHDKL